MKKGVAKQGYRMYTFGVMKTIRVVLEITYDDNHNKSPVDWNWPNLLDGLDEQVKLVAAQEMVIEDHEPTN